MQPDFLWMLGGSVALGAVVWWQNGRRRGAMTAVATRLGLTYKEQANTDAFRTLLALRAIADVPILIRGFRQWSTNEMAGQRGGRELRLFDFHYSLRAKGVGAPGLTVVLVPGAGAGLPDFALAPATAFDKLGEAFGSRDIDFPTHPEFSRQYLPRGADEPAIRRAFGPRALELFSRERDWRVEVANGHLAAWRATKPISPSEVPELVDGTLRIVAVLAPSAP